MAVDFDQRRATLRGDRDLGEIYRDVNRLNRLDLINELTQYAGGRRDLAERLAEDPWLASVVIWLGARLGATVVDVLKVESRRVLVISIPAGSRPPRELAGELRASGATNVDVVYAEPGHKYLMRKLDGKPVIVDVEKGIYVDADAVVGAIWRDLSVTVSERAVAEVARSYGVPEEAVVEALKERFGEVIVRGEVKVIEVVRPGELDKVPPGYWAAVVDGKVVDWAPTLDELVKRMDAKGYGRDQYSVLKVPSHDLLIL